MLLARARITAATALLAATALTATAAPVPANATTEHSGTTTTATTTRASAVTADTSIYTRDTLDLSGRWAVEYTFTQYKGQPVAANPPPFPTDQTYYVNLVRAPAGTVTSPPGNEPVYSGNWIDPVTGQINAPGELIVSPFTSPRGIVLTMWMAGNPDTGFADAYDATFAAHAANDTTQPLQFTGTWRDVDDNGGDLVSMHRIGPN